MENTILTKKQRHLIIRALARYQVDCFASNHAETIKDGTEITMILASMAQPFTTLALVQRED